MKKRFLSLGLAFIMLFALAGLSGCRWERNYRWSESSFLFETTASKTDVRVGDTIELTSTFRNLSGRNLLVTVPARRIFDDDPTNLEQIIFFGLTLGSATPRSLRIPYNAVVSVVNVFTVECICEYLYNYHYEYIYDFHKCNLCLYGHDFFEVPTSASFYMGRLRNRDLHNIDWTRLLDNVFLRSDIILNVTAED